ncbi:MAG TPA: RsiV family protein [Mycobacteriales bacterium]|nr:RsiV family protein [Mycobacteriales bacterium]
MRRLLVVPAVAAALAGAPVVATQASAATPLPALVTLAQHLVREGSAANHDASSRPVVTGITGVPTAIAKKVASAINQAAVKPLRAPRPAHDSIEVTAAIVEQDKRYLTAEIRWSSYIWMAAHPETSVAEVLFDRTTGAVIPLEEVFAPGKLSDGLKKLGAAVRAHAPGELGPAYDADSVRFGTVPAGADNLGALVPRPWGLEVAFGQGQIAAEAAGPLYVVVPWAALGSLVALPLPQGGVPLPPYRAGQPVADKTTLKALASATLAVAPFNAKPKAYRLQDARVAYSFSSDPDEAPGVFAVLRAVPTANPGNTHTVLLVGQDGDITHPAVSAVASGAVGCATLPSGVLAQLAMKCPAAAHAQTAHRAVADVAGTPVSLRLHTVHKTVRGTKVTRDVVDGLPGLTRSVAGRIASTLNKATAQMTTPDATRPRSETAQLRLVEQDSRFVVVLLFAGYDGGGAHGSHAVHTYVFTRKDGAQKTLTALVKPGALDAVLQKLSSAARKQLPAMIGNLGNHAELVAGTYPDRGNYLDVFPRTDGLAVIFGEYQVASYAAGILQITVPWSGLRGSLKAAPPAPTLGASLAARSGHPLWAPFATKATVAAGDVEGGAYGEVLLSRPVQPGNAAVPVQYGVGQAVLSDDSRVTFAVSSADYGTWHLVAEGTPGEVCAALPGSARKDLRLRCDGA